VSVPVCQRSWKRDFEINPAGNRKYAIAFGQVSTYTGLGDRGIGMSMSHWDFV